MLLVLSNFSYEIRDVGDYSTFSRKPRVGIVKLGSLKAAHKALCSTRFSDYKLRQNIAGLQSSNSKPSLRAGVKQCSL